MWPFGKSIEDRLNEVLKGYRALEDQDFKVVVAGKTVTYSGSVSTVRHKNLLVSAASALDGIEEVDTSGLAVGAVEAGGGEDPAALAREVSKRIKQHPSLADDPIDVWQVGSLVKLRGAVDSETEYEAAVASAEAVAGRGNVDSSALRKVANVKKLLRKNPGGEVVYEVQPGDTLSAIALKYYGSASRSAYMRIAEHNGIDNPDLIQVGQQLVIPGSPDGPDGTLA